MAWFDDCRTASSSCALTRDPARAPCEHADSALAVWARGTGCKDAIGDGMDGARGTTGGGEICAPVRACVGGRGEWRGGGRFFQNEMIAAFLAGTGGGESIPRRTSCRSEAQSWSGDKWKATSGRGQGGRAESELHLRGVAGDR